MQRAGATLCCAGFLLRWLLLLQSTGFKHAGFSSCALGALERRLCSCGAWAYLLRDMWDLPGPGLKPLSPALAGGFLTTAPPGKSQPLFTVSIVLPFPECHTLGIIQHVAFSDWLLSLSNMHLRLLRVFSWLDSSFLFRDEQYSIVWM